MDIDATERELLKHYRQAAPEKRRLISTLASEAALLATKKQTADLLPKARQGG
jgi:hypothetical protein